MSTPSPYLGAHTSPTLYLYPYTEHMLAHCHCSKNGGATYVLLDNNNVENIAQEMVRLLFVLYRSPLPIRLVRKTPDD